MLTKDFETNPETVVPISGANGVGKLVQPQVVGSAYNENTYMLI